MSRPGSDDSSGSWADTATSTANTTICDVTELQADGIRLLFRNSSCDYNMTVASILASG